MSIDFRVVILIEVELTLVFEATVTVVIPPLVVLRGGHRPASGEIVADEASSIILAPALNRGDFTAFVWLTTEHADHNFSINRR